MNNMHIICNSVVDAQIKTIKNDLKLKEYYRLEKIYLAP